jgi:hypothetical protein
MTEEENCARMGNGSLHKRESVERLQAGGCSTSAGLVNARYAPVVGQLEKHIPTAAKAAIDFEAFTARLKPRPFKTDSN